MMAQEFFGRHYQLSFGEEPITDLQITFDVKRTSTKEPNTATIGLINLSLGTRAKLLKNVPVDLAIGWGDTLPATIFLGEIVSVNHAKSGAEWITKLECADSNAQIRKHARISLSRKCTLDQVVGRLVAELEINAADAANAIVAAGKELGVKDFSKGYVFVGRPIEALDVLARSVNLALSVQDRRVIAVPIAEALPNPAVLLSPSTGLISSPEPGEKGIIKVTSLLQPQIKPQAAVRLESSGLKGDYKAITVNHVGDFRGNEWYSKLELRPL